MSRFLICSFALLLASCTVGEGGPANVAAASRLAQEDIRTEIEARFGAAALRHARSAEAFVAVVRYAGRPAPDHDTDGQPIPPFHPSALAFRENGLWFAYGREGRRPVLPRWSARLETILRNPALWDELSRGEALGCGTADTHYAWIRAMGRPEQVKIARCRSPMTEELVDAVLMS